MKQLKSRGLHHFLKRYVDSHSIDLKKFLINLDMTIASFINASASDQPEEELIHQIQPFIKLERSIIKFLSARKKLPQYNTIDDAVSLIQEAKNILILTGAGISTSCGIPDFRSQNGLYAQLENYDGLDDPHDMFDLGFFKSNPRPFYKFIRDIFPFSSSTSTITNDGSQAITTTTERPMKSINPSISHRFIKLVESNSKLLRNYTQNIDTLEMKAGVQNLIQCHGSFATFTCLKCGKKYPANQFEDLIAKAEIVLCPSCDSPGSSDSEVKASFNKRRKTNSGGRRRLDASYQDESGEDGDDDHGEIDWVSLGLMKPDIVFFGEGLPREFDDAIEADRLKCDLMIVIGTSLKVAPVSEIIKYVPTSIPQILINRDPIYQSKRSSLMDDPFEYHGDEFEFDIFLFGECDQILTELCTRLGKSTWDLTSSDSKETQESATRTHATLSGSDPPSQSKVPEHNRLSQENQSGHGKQFGAHVNHIWLFPGSNPNHPWFDKWIRIGQERSMEPDPQDSCSSESDSEETEEAKNESTPATDQHHHESSDDLDRRKVVTNPSDED